MDVYWLEQSVADVPVENDWLSPREAISLNRLRFPKRRADWRLGRWTAKSLLADFLNIPKVPRLLASIELQPSESGAPELFVDGERSAVPISLSHRAGIAVCVIAPSAKALGCDLELIEPRSEAFVADYFTSEEQALIAQASPADRLPLVTLLWSAKESALKATRTGLRVDTRSLIVTPRDALQVQGTGDENHKDGPVTEAPSSHWCPFEVHHSEGQTFHGWWWQAGNLMRTVIAAPPRGAPIVFAQRSLTRGNDDRVLSKAS